VSGVVLVIEDDELLRFSLTQWLELEGHRVIEARHGREALSKLGGGLRPDVIVLDLLMPEMSGWEFRRAQLAEPALAEIPVLLASGADAVAEEAAALGAAGHLEKPFRMGRVVELVAPFARRQRGQPT
jgi:CheY-like chemotaxis protein